MRKKLLPYREPFREDKRIEGKVLLLLERDVERTKNNFQARVRSFKAANRGSAFRVYQGKEQS